MAVFDIAGLEMKGVAVCVPKNRKKNTDLPLSDQEKNQLIKSTGIEERTIAPASLCASDLCLAAAQKLMGELNWRADEIEALVFVTQTPDYVLPGTSMLLQEKLGLSSSCLLFDINQGCAGYVYGFSFLASLMKSANLKKGLLLVGDTITHLISEKDMSLVPIFSDAGSATAVEQNENAAPVSFHLQANGKGYSSIIVPAGGSRKPLPQANSSEDELRTEADLHMNGHEVFQFGLKEIAPNISELLAHTNRKKEEIDAFVLHQANQLLNEAIRKKIGATPEQFPYSLQKFGNTSCATIPVTLVHAMKDKLTKEKLSLVFCGFGVGLSWGSMYLQTSNLVCPDVLEI